MDGDQYDEFFKLRVRVQPMHQVNMDTGMDGHMSNPEKIVFSLPKTMYGEMISPIRIHTTLGQNMHEPISCHQLRPITCIGQISMQLANMKK